MKGATKSRQASKHGFLLLLVIVAVAVVIIPAILLGAALLSQATATYGRIQTGDIDLGRAFVEAERHLPDFARNWLADLGLTDFAAVQARISQGIAAASGCWQVRHSTSARARSPSFSCSA